MAYSHTQRQIGANLDRILNVPSAGGLPPADLDGIEHGNNIRRLALQEVLKIEKLGDAISLIGGIIIRLNMLKPNPGTDQVRASRELKIVGGRQQVPCDHFELLRSHAAGTRYAAHAANACRADRDGSNRVPGDQRNN